jgi:hypothetical protein
MQADNEALKEGKQRPLDFCLGSPPPQFVEEVQLQGDVHRSVAPEFFQFFEKAVTGMATGRVASTPGTNPARPWLASARHPHFA